MPFDARDLLDQRIDAALASYASASPRRGLEKRVMRRIAPPGRQWNLPPWIGAKLWAVPLAAAACLVAGIISMAASGVSASVGPSPVASWCAWLEQTRFSVSLRESIWMWWYVEGGHLLALAVMLGPALMLDLRLLGWLWKRDPVSKVESRFLPLTLAGFAMVAITGALLFVSEPVKCYESVYFRIKIGLIALAGINALVFHATVDRRRAQWDTVLPPPPAARRAGLLGLILWTGVIFAGRYMAYLFSL